VTRADLPPAVQAVQAAHAGLALAVKHGTLVDQWDADGGFLIILAVPDELALCWLLADAGRDGQLAVPFHEPDLGGALTAVALTGGALPLVRKLSLALKGT
jgi:hypothetical protein